MLPSSRGPHEKGAAQGNKERRAFWTVASITRVSGAAATQSVVRMWVRRASIRPSSGLVGTAHASVPPMLEERSAAAEARVLSGWLSWAACCAWPVSTSLSSAVENWHHGSEAASAESCDVRTCVLSAVPSRKADDRVYERCVRSQRPGRILPLVRGCEVARAARKESRQAPRTPLPCAVRHYGRRLRADVGASARCVCDLQKAAWSQAIGSGSLSQNKARARPSLRGLQ